MPGNHDITNSTMTEVWQQRYGKSYYYFIYKNVLFLCLNTNDPPEGQISAAQIDYMREVLAKHQDVRWTIVFMHHPLFVSGNQEWNRLEMALKDRPHTVFAGHFHNYAKYEKHGRSYIILSTTGGTNALRGPDFGEFDHLVWVTMTESGPDCQFDDRWY
ncbi:MAG: metallophosphoesterase [Planctomycetes bacterium]|nr:metallophosphoesterase [Planctomycetota bacterium]